jgi:hypothetical protein
MICLNANVVMDDNYQKLSFNYKIKSNLIRLNPN